MADPVIVPPVPTVTQGDSPDQIAAATKNVQDIFDRVAPAIKTAPSQPVTPQPPAATTPPPVTPTESPTETPPPPVTPETPGVEPERKLPSFLEKALEVEPASPEATQAKAQTQVDDEWPEELPSFKSSDEAKTRYKNWREKYKALKTETENLRNRPAFDDEQKARVDFLENQNKEMGSVLNRLSVETHQEFQQNIIRPMHMAWSEAAKIVAEAGGNPDDLAKALTLNGKAHFQALDQIFEPLPDSAKAEAQPAIAAYRRLDDARKSALADAPRTMEALRKKDLERHHEFLQKQKQDMSSLFDEAVRVLRDEAKVELLQTSTEPDAKWWNDQGETLVSGARRLYLDNTDMKKMALACVLAPMADTYRKLWLQERAARQKETKVMKDRYGAEPFIGESGGNTRSETPSLQEDLKQPFHKVFMRELQKQHAKGVR